MLNKNPYYGFTYIQKKIMRILADGLPHTLNELMQVMSSDKVQRTAVQMQLSQMRKVLRRRGENILCVFDNRKFKYQHVILLNRTEEQEERATSNFKPLFSKS